MIFLQCNISQVWNTISIAAQLALFLTTGTITALRNKLKRQKNIQLYPNPNNGTFTILIDANNRKDYHLEVLDLSGKIVYRKENLPSSHEVLNLKGIQSGFYLIKIFNSKDELFEKLIIR